ncbi:MAG: hypothetical protein AB8I08_09250 [Sandaracinaceae bacterium]
MKRGFILMGVLLALSGCVVTDTGNPPLTPPDPDETVVMSLLGGTVTVQGMAGAVDGSSGVVRLTNLDDGSAPVDAPIQADGSFSAALQADIGDVLRLQRVEGSLRSVPVDLDAGSGEPAEVRVPCLSVSTTFLDVDVLEATTDFDVTVDNNCGAEVLVETRFRGADGPTMPSIDSPLPIAPDPNRAVLPAGGSTTMTLSVSPPSAPEGEDVVLLLVDDGAARRAVTVWGTR